MLHKVDLEMNMFACWLVVIFPLFVRRNAECI